MISKDTTPAAQNDYKLDIFEGYTIFSSPFGINVELALWDACAKGEWGI